MMNVLLAGASGYVGGIINRELKDNFNIIKLNKRSMNDDNILCDLSDFESAKKLRIYKPDIIIHAAGNKNIQECEDNPHIAHQANTLSLINLIRVFNGEAKIIYISTDYVFSGGEGLYKERDQAHPLTEYGRSKLRAEYECINAAQSSATVLRLSALLDINATFPKFILSSLEEGREIECYSNVFYSPTYYVDFCLILRKLIECNDLKSKVYHSCGHRISRYDFAKNLCDTLGYDNNLIIERENTMENKYLFHDLSLSNQYTEKELGVKKSNIEKILRNIESSRKNESN